MFFITFFLPQNFDTFLFCLLLVVNGYVNKAVNYDGEMFVIEEIQLYEEPVPINTLRLSQSKVTQYGKPWQQAVAFLFSFIGVLL